MPEQQSSQPNTSEKTLLERAVRGDAAAFDDLLDALLPVMFRQAMKVMGEVSDAEDAVQEASLRIFRGIGSFKGDAAVATWATRITLNCCYDLFRQKKGVVQVPLELETEEGTLDRVIADPAPGPAERLETKETVLAVREAALSLKEPFRTTLIEIDLLQKSYDEVAAHMGVPIGTVKSRLSRARSMAGAWLKKQGTKPGKQPSNRQTNK